MAARRIEPACPIIARAIVAGWVLMAAPVMARAGTRAALKPRTIRLAELREEDIGPEDLPSPTATPNAQASPAAQGGAQPQAPATQPPSRVPTPAEAVAPGTTPAPPEAPIGQEANPAIPPATAAGAETEPGAAVEPGLAAEPGVAGAAEPSATPTELAPIEIGEMTPTLQISNASLKPLIATAATPALAASLRITDEARADILSNRADDAIELLSRALSIDPGNSYAYLYLGRAWLAKKNYPQSMTFFKRAEVAFASNPDWLAETLAFEGRAYEESGQPQQAEKQYQQALQASPGNLMARVGLMRLNVTGGAPTEGATPAEFASPAGSPSPSESASPAATGSEAPPAPSESPAPPPPAAEPPPPAN